MRQIMFVLMFSLFFSSSILEADTKVAVSEISPMCFSDKNGRMKGFSIDLLNKVSEITNDTYQLTNFDNVTSKLDSILENKSDLAICGISYDYDRAQKMESLKIIETGSIAVALVDDSVFGFVKRLVQTDILSSIVPFFIFLLLSGGIFYFLEYGKIRVKKDGKEVEATVKSLEDAIFLAMTTASTVGYGNQVPLTLLGRVFATIIMIVGISYFAYVGSNVWSETSKAFSKYEIKGASDLKQYKVGTVENTSNQRYLTANKVKTTTYKNVKELQNALLNKEVELIVYDELSLLYFAANNPNVIPAGSTFNKLYYSWFISQNGLSKKKEIELALLKLQEDGDFSKLLEKWFAK